MREILWIVRSMCCIYLREKLFFLRHSIFFQETQRRRMHTEKGNGFKWYTKKFRFIYTNSSVEMLENMTQNKHWIAAALDTTKKNVLVMIVVSHVSTVPGTLISKSFIVICCLRLPDENKCQVLLHVSA